MPGPSRSLEIHVKLRPDASAGERRAVEALLLEAAAGRSGRLFPDLPAADANSLVLFAAGERGRIEDALVALQDEPAVEYAEPLRRPAL